MVASYSKSYNNADDYAWKKNLKFLISFEHHFLSSWEVSVETFLRKLVLKLGKRERMLIYHSYSPVPEFNTHDFLRVTFGNIGVIAG